MEFSFPGLKVIHSIFVLIVVSLNIYVYLPLLIYQYIFLLTIQVFENVLMSFASHHTFPIILIMFKTLVLGY